MRKIHWIAAAILAMATASVAVTIDGIVRDQNGESVAGALVSFASEDGTGDVSARTASDGS